MPDSYKKTIGFMSVFALSFVLFCIFSVRLGMLHQDPTVQAKVADYVYPLIFLFFQIAAIVFTAIIRSSRLLIGIPIILSIFAGVVIVDSVLASFLLLGLPFVILFMSIWENTSNRIRMHFSTDVRRPLTTFFLFFLFFGCFIVVPHYESQIQNALNTYMQEFIPQQTGVQNPPILDLQRSMSDLIDEQVQAAAEVCQGDTGCEQMVEEKIREESANFLQQIPMLSDIDISSEKPILTEVMDKSFEKVVPKNVLERFGIESVGNSFIWALLAFLLISPFSIVFSFITLLGIRAIYGILRLSGVLHVTVKNVQKQVLV
jgi:hypothetical protein